MDAALKPIGIKGATIASGGETHAEAIHPENYEAEKLTQVEINVDETKQV